MIAYVFWHRPFADIGREAYEAALTGFHRALCDLTCDGFQGSATYRIDETPWLDGMPGYEDWNFVATSAGLDPLNKAAVAPDMWDVHAGISSKTDIGHGGIYYPIMGEADARVSTRSAWLKRPRGIRYEAPMRDMIDAAPCDVSVWRKQMVLGPGSEFVVLGNASLALDPPEGWDVHYVDRILLHSGSTGR